MTEQWRPIVGWSQHYEISDMGRVRSLDRTCGSCYNSTQLRRGRMLVQVPKQGRYLAVTLADKDRREQHSVHELVLNTFVGPCPAGMQACHRDDDKGNNALSNLRWDTPTANMADRKANTGGHEGERHPLARLTEQNVRFIRNSGSSGVALAQVFGVTPSHIWSIRNRRTWKHI